jgi:predicted lipoprotein with Yx(FWY)xxD motif
MRNGVKVACVLATGLGLLTMGGCGEKHKAVPSSGGFAQPTSPGVPSPPETSPPASPGPESSPPEATTSASPGAVMVSAQDTRVGKILVDGKQMTLYIFEKDKGGKPTCTGACATAWPPLVTTDKVEAGSGVNASWLSTADRPDGTKQVTYHGWPLYHYAKDTKPGDMTGQALNQFGGAWYVMDATKGEKIEKK